MTLTSKKLRDQRHYLLRSCYLVNIKENHNSEQFTTIDIVSKSSPPVVASSSTKYSYECPNRWCTGIPFDWINCWDWPSISISQRCNEGRCLPTKYPCARQEKVHFDNVPPSDSCSMYRHRYQATSVVGYSKGLAKRKYDFHRSRLDRKWKANV